MAPSTGGAVELNFPPLPSNPYPLASPASREASGRDSKSERLKRERLRLLPGVARQPLGVQIDAQLTGAAGTQLVLGQHAQDGLAHHHVGALRPEPLRRDLLQATGVTAVMAVHLLLELVSGQADLIGEIGRASC